MKRFFCSWPGFMLVIVALMSFAFGSIVAALADDQARTITFFIDKPSCAQPRAVDLPSSWRDMSHGGITVWYCAE